MTGLSKARQWWNREKYENFLSDDAKTPAMKTTQPKHKAQNLLEPRKHLGRECPKTVHFIFNV